jgi:hypothetical protein
MALSSLIVLLTVTSVFAQAERRVLVDIPFQFTVGEKTLPAGEYIIEPNRRDTDTIWVLRNAKGRETVMLMTIPIRANRTQEQAKVVFRRYDELYFLAQVWTPGTNTGREMRITGREKALELASVKIREEHVLIAGQ